MARVPSKKSESVWPLPSQTAQCPRSRNDPGWKPTGFLSGGGYHFNMIVRKPMRSIWRLQAAASPRQEQGCLAPLM